jgi:adenosylcobinamide-phosphate synthase
MIKMRAIVVLAAYLLDLIFGDPQWFPHPVRGIGWLIEKSEAAFRRMIKDERLSGTIFTLAIIILVWAVTIIMVKAAYLFNYYFGIFVSIVIVYMSLSIKDLAVESLEVFKALSEKDMDKSRKALSRIVARDTASLDEREITRAAVETVAENIVDGIISPLFYAFLGGAPAAMAYKAVNTLDSMIGYKNERYINFGWAAAKIDDAVNYIPARLSVIFITFAGWIGGCSPIRTWKIAMRDGGKNPSPNSGLSEAAIAGALDVRLGGLNYYNSVAIEKPYMGDGINPLNKSHIKEAIKIAYIASVLFVIVGVILCWIMGRGKFL